MFDRRKSTPSRNGCCVPIAARCSVSHQGRKNKSTGPGFDPPRVSIRIHAELMSRWVSSPNLNWLALLGQLTARNTVTLLGKLRVRRGQTHIDIAARQIENQPQHLGGQLRCVRDECSAFNQSTERPACSGPEHGASRGRNTRGFQQSKTFDLDVVPSRLCEKPRCGRGSLVRADNLGLNTGRRAASLL